MSLEFELIQTYFADQVRRDDVLLGIGDDAACIRTSAQTLICTDTLVENTHFFSDADPYDIGWKALAVNLSDMAAMNAMPKWFTLNLTLPHFQADWLKRFSQGLFALANQYELQLIGGDTTQGPLTISVTLAGDSTQPARRDGAKAGDKIYVSGQLGNAWLGYALHENRLVLDSTYHQLARTAFHRPQPRLDISSQLGQYFSSCIDISDGLLADLAHITAASVVGAKIDLTRLPLSAPMQSYIASTGDWEKVLSWGDDYQLCFSVAADTDAILQEKLVGSALDVTCIGSISDADGMVIRGLQGEVMSIKEKGYSHFANAD